MDIGFYTKKLLIAIAIVLLLLGVCVSVDYASSNDTISNMNESTMAKNVSKNTIMVNDSSPIAVNHTASVIIGRSSDVIHTIHPEITITARPSCGCGKHYSYRWRTRTFINCCPHCHRYGVLYNAHKWQAKHEQELTCRHCGADYCGNCGKEKYSWSKYYLRKA